LAKRNEPLASAAAVRLTPAAECSLTEAPGMTAPDESVTEPVMRPVAGWAWMGCCAQMNAAKKASALKRRNACMGKLLIG
jgi:hypothetical protein